MPGKSRCKPAVAPTSSPSAANSCPNCLSQLLCKVGPAEGHRCAGPVGAGAPLSIRARQGTGDSGSFHLHCLESALCEARSIRQVVICFKALTCFLSTAVMLGSCLEAALVLGSAHRQACQELHLASCCSMDIHNIMNDNGLR